VVTYHYSAREGGSCIKKRERGWREEVHEESKMYGSMRRSAET
jgi:hypothetical protein